LNEEDKCVSLGLPSRASILDWINSFGLVDIGSREHKKFTRINLFLQEKHMKRKKIMQIKEALTFFYRNLRLDYILEYYVVFSTLIIIILFYKLNIAERASEIQHKP
ncbi:hypothetical protein ACJX0J_028414, partial [Zea mays]